MNFGEVWKWKFNSSDFTNQNQKNLIEFNNYLILNFISDFTHNSAKMEMQMENAKPVWIIDEVLFEENSHAFWHELERLKELME